MQIVSLIGHTQELLGEILPSKKPADALIDTFFRARKYLGSHDRRFIAETTYGTLRHLRRCRYSLDQILGTGMEIPETDLRILSILLFLSLEKKLPEECGDILQKSLRHPDLKSRASSIAEKLAVVPPIEAETSVRKIGLEYSFPDWMVERFIEQYGEKEAEKICARMNTQAPLTLRVNTLKATVEQCQEELAKQGIETIRTTYSPVGLHLKKRMNVFTVPRFRDGWFEVQDEGSQLLPILIDPKPNSKVLDVCAGAGGKTLQLAALMKNRGEIFAADINAFRLDELRKRTKRAGVQNVRVQQIESIDSLEDRFAGFFDIVFIDAPCSGLGTLRRNPGMKWMVTEQTVQEVSERQEAILHSSVSLLKPGGTFIYATCTLLRQENENRIEKFLLQHTECSAVSVPQTVPGIPPAENAAPDPYIRLFPHIHGTDAFFCAFVKKQ